MRLTRGFCFGFGEGLGNIIDQAFQTFFRFRGQPREADSRKTFGRPIPDGDVGHDLLAIRADGQLKLLVLRQPPVDLNPTTGNPQTHHPNPGNFRLLCGFDQGRRIK